MIQQIEYNSIRRAKYKHRIKKPIAITVFDYITEAKRRCRARVYKKHVASVLEIFANGSTITEISMSLFIHHSAVSDRLSKHFFYYKGDDAVTITIPSKV